MSLWSISKSNMKKLNNAKQPIYFKKSEVNRPNFFNRVGLPYRGSKRQHAKKICDFILLENPNLEHFYDLFGGGGAVSLEMSKRGINVYYSEIHKPIFDIFDKIKRDGITYDDFKIYPSRERFFNDATPIEKLCFSFGSDFRSYIYGKHKEAEKKALFDEVLKYHSENDVSLKEAKGIIGKKHNLGNSPKLEHLPKLGQLEKISLMDLSNVTFSNSCYLDVEITTPLQKTVLYVDAPYENTEAYHKINFDFEKLDKYINQSPFKIYRSEYVEIEDLTKCLEIKTKCSLGDDNAKPAIEKLFKNFW